MLRLIHWVRDLNGRVTQRAAFAALMYLGGGGVGLAVLLVAVFLSPPGGVLRGLITEPIAQLVRPDVAAPAQPSLPEGPPARPEVALAPPLPSPDLGEPRAELVSAPRPESAAEISTGETVPGAPLAPEAIEVVPQPRREPPTEALPVAVLEPGRPRLAADPIGRLPTPVAGTPASLMLPALGGGFGPIGGAFQASIAQFGGGIPGSLPPQGPPSSPSAPPAAGPAAVPPVASAPVGFPSLPLEGAAQPVPASPLRTKRTAAGAEGGGAPTLGLRQPATSRAPGSPGHGSTLAQTDPARESRATSVPKAVPAGHTPSTLPPRGASGAPHGSGAAASASPTVQVAPPMLHGVGGGRPSAQPTPAPHHQNQPAPAGHTAAPAPAQNENHSAAAGQSERPPAQGKAAHLPR